jgi:hypothetical protein
MSILPRIAVLVFLALTLLGSPDSFADDRKALVGGRLIDGLLGDPIANSVILIDGDTISAIGTVDTLPVPDGYEVISTEGMSVLPGLWDMHVHTAWHGDIYETFFEEFIRFGVVGVRDMGGDLDVLEQARWPHGFRCPRCGARAIACCGPKPVRPSSATPATTRNR